MRTHSVVPIKRLGSERELICPCLPCCHGEMAQCLARHQSHWQQNHSQMFCHWLAGCKPARIFLRGERNLSNEKKKGGWGGVKEMIGQSSNPSCESSSHHSQVWVFAVGNWAAPLRWRSFPPHTGIPEKLCGTPELTQDPEIQEKRKKV